MPATVETLHICQVACPAREYRCTAKKDDQRDVTQIKAKKTESLVPHTRPIGSNMDCNLQRDSSIKGTTAKLAALSLNRQSSGGDIMDTNQTIGQIRNTAIVVGAAALLPLSAYATMSAESGSSLSSAVKTAQGDRTLQHSNKDESGAEYLSCSAFSLRVSSLWRARSRGSRRTFPARGSVPGR